MGNSVIIRNARAMQLINAVSEIRIGSEEHREKVFKAFEIFMLADKEMEDARDSFHEYRKEIGPIAHRATTDEAFSNA